mmetsp:Transcript_52007/g.58090  ORF Transcript_52007/g.58090 Transcript_52007/m.58090 type:complete len:97 (-) Transcript_52007:384-674(-)
MRRDSLRFFQLILLQGSVTVLDIQITVSVIVNEIQMVARGLVARWMSIGSPECSCLNSNNITNTSYRCCLVLAIVVVATADVDADADVIDDGWMFV